LDATNNGAVSKLVKAWEAKNGRSAKRVAGLGLMAVSLAACNDEIVDVVTPVTPVVVTPVSAALTVGTDTVAGTTGNDSVTGARIDTVQTLNSGDSIALGAGTDSLSATLNAGTVTPASITGVESITLTALGAATIDFDNVSGVTSITSTGSSATLVVDDIQSLVTSISVNNATANQTFTFKDAAVAGSADSLRINLDGVAIAAGSNLDIGGETDADGDIETIVVNATGGASDLGDGGGFGADATTITVIGSANLDLGSAAQFVSVTSFDATASTGDVTATFATRTSAGETAVALRGGAGDDSFDIGLFTIANYGDLTVAMGAGDDTLDIGAVRDTDSGSSFAGGAGTDTLIISGAVIDATTAALITGFEVLNIETTGLTQDADNFSGTTFGTGALVVGMTMAISDLANNSVLNANHSITTLTGALKTNSAADAVTVNIGGAAAVTAGAIVLSTTYETITINSRSDSTANGDNIVTAITNTHANLVVTGSHDITFTTLANISGVTDMSAATGDNVVTVTGVGASTLNFGSGDDVLTASGVVGTAVTQIINGGAGDDTLTAGAIVVDGAGIVINGDAGSDTISVAAVAGTAAGLTTTATVNGGAGFDFITVANVADANHVVVSTATGVADADEVTGFTTTEHDFDYNGAVSNDGVTTIVAVSNATLAGGLAADADATVYIVTTDFTGAAATDMAALVAATTVATIAAAYATFEASLLTSLGTITGLDATLGAAESVLLAVDDGTNSVILRLTNTSTATANTLIGSEVDLVAIMVAAPVLVVGDFI
jgi:hypothetical protein